MTDEAGNLNPPHRATDRQLNLVIVLVVVAVYLPTLAVIDLPLTSATVLFLLTIGIAYSINGVVIFGWINRQKRTSLSLIFFAIQITLVGSAFVIAPASGLVWWLALPLVSQAVVTLPRIWLFVIVAVILASFFGLGVITQGWEGAIAGLLFFSAGILFVLVFTQIYVSERRARREIQHLAARLEEANAQLGAYAVQVEELATTKERNRLAREIHDSLGHYLTIINVQLEAARAALITNPKIARDALEKAQSLTKEGLTEVRRSISALRGSPLEGHTLPEVLETLVEECQSAGIIGVLRLSGKVRDLPNQVEHALFRAAQEGLTNVRKHARASRVVVDLEYSADGEVELAIEDNGVGSDSRAFKKGYGLLGLRERVQLLGGHLSAGPISPRGFRLEVKLHG